MTIRQLIEAALQDLSVLGAGQTATATDAALGLARLNELFDSWNATRRAVYAARFDTFTLTPDLSPHTIGSGGTFSLTQRPVSIEAAGLILTTSDPDLRTPITIRDAQWWAGQSVKALSTSIPTDLYYQPDWPLGKCFFWPVPDTAYGVELQTRVVLASVALTDTFTLPPGYEIAIRHTLAEELEAPFGAQLPGSYALKATMARARIFDTNTQAPRLATQDVGMPASGGGRTFNYLDRSM